VPTSQSLDSLSRVAETLIEGAHGLDLTWLGLGLGGLVEGGEGRGRRRGRGGGGRRSGS